MAEPGSCIKEKRRNCVSETPGHFKALMLQLPKRGPPEVRTNGTSWGDQRPSGAGRRRSNVCVLHRKAAEHVCLCLLCVIKNESFGLRVIGQERVRFGINPLLNYHNINYNNNHKKSISVQRPLQNNSSPSRVKKGCEWGGGFVLLFRLFWSSQAVGGAAAVS